MLTSFEDNAHSRVVIGIDTSVTPENEIHAYAYSNDKRILDRVMAVRLRIEASDLLAHLRLLSAMHQLTRTRAHQAHVELDQSVAQKGANKDSTFA